MRNECPEFPDGGARNLLDKFLSVAALFSSKQQRSLQVIHRVNEAIRSVFVKLAPKLHLVKAPSLASKDRSVPVAILLLPRTPEKFTMGLTVNPMLELIPAYSYR